MNKKQLIEAVAKDAKISREKSEQAVDSFIKNVTKSLKRGNKVTLVGFGTFSSSKRDAIRRNPITGRPQHVTTGNVRFKASGPLPGDPPPDDFPDDEQDTTRED